MNLSHAKPILSLIACLLLGIGFVGCDDSSSSNDLAALVPPIQTGNPSTLAGSWAITVNHNTHNQNIWGGDNGQCGEGVFENPHVIGMVQLSDSLFQIIPWEGDPINATLVGDVLSFEIAVADGIGTTTSDVEIRFIAVDDEYVSFSGDADYVYEDDVWGSCTGTDDWTGAKASGEMAGLWNLNVEVVDTDCTDSLPVEALKVSNFPLGDNGDAVLIPLPGTDELIEATYLDATTLSIDHNYTDGDDYVVVAGTLTISEDGNTIGGLDDENILSFTIFAEETCTGDVNFMFTRE